MKFRSMVLVLTIAFSAIFVCMLGTSYAYYAITDGVDVNITTGDIDGVAITFNQSQYINFDTGIPTDEMNASKSVFTITPNSSVLVDANVAINVGIVDILIDDELIVNDFRYKFVCNDGTNNVVSNSGTGAEFTAEVIANDYFELGSLSTSTSTFDASKVYTCTLSIWVQETLQNQNHLMNKNFRGLIKVNTLFKK